MPYSKRFRWGIQLADGRRGYGIPMEQSDADFDISGRGGGAMAPCRSIGSGFTLRRQQR